MFNWTLGRKFSAFLALLALLGCCLTVFTLSRHLNHQAEQAVEERAELLLTTMQAARNYTRDHVQPMLKRELSTDEHNFIPESIPNFAARTIFSSFRQQNPEFKDFLYKEAALNPTNPDDQANELEAQLIEEMKVLHPKSATTGDSEGQVNQPFHQAANQTDNQTDKQTELSGEEQLPVQLSGYYTMNGEKLFYLAQPLIMDSAKCLACHGSASDAPQYLLDMYGSENGFNWQLNDVVAAQIMYVPARQIFERSHQNLFTVTKSLLSIFGAIFIVINLLLWRAVSRPLSILTQTSKQISSCSINKQAVVQLEDQGLSELAMRKDEPGQLARAFEYMLSVLSKREQDLQQAVKDRTQSLELEMRDRQTAQEALQTYTHAINHDLRNMVMGISNLLQVIGIRWQQQGQPGDSSVTVEPQALEMMQKSCDRQLQLMNSLMEVQASDVWRTVLNLEPVNLNQLCQDLEQTYRTKLRQTTSKLVMEISPGLPVIQGDPMQIERVFENLIGNALKYNPEGVEVRVRVMLSERNLNQIYCVVSDNGVGVTTCENMFKLYRRGQSSEQTTGQGLGLFICRKIVEAHGGEIGCKSAQHQGAKFWFALPCESSSSLGRQKPGF